jgi:hypothetical protein
MAPWKRGVGTPRGRNFFWALAHEAANNVDEPDCYSKKLFEQAPKYNISELELSTLAGALFGAGSDTSSSTLITFILACCAFPDVLPKAWEELDRVVGPYKSPSFNDEPNLVYIKAFVKEVLRWRPVAILGGQPHAPIQDEIYKVYSIININTKYLIDIMNRVGQYQKIPGYKETFGPSIGIRPIFRILINLIQRDISREAIHSVHLQMI